MSPDVAGKVWDNVNQGIFDHMHSPQNEKKLGGLLAMGWFPGFLCSMVQICFRLTAAD
jgi:hypothetical protein